MMKKLLYIQDYKNYHFLILNQILYKKKNLEVENWEKDKNSNKDNIDINTIKENLEKLL